MSCQGPLWSPPPQTQDVTPRPGALLGLLLGQMAPSGRRSHQMPGLSSHAPPLILSKSWLFFKTASRAPLPPAPCSTLTAALSPWQCRGVPHKMASSSSSDASTEKSQRPPAAPLPSVCPQRLSPPVCQPSCSQTTPFLKEPEPSTHRVSIPAPAPETPQREHLLVHRGFGSAPFSSGTLVITAAFPSPLLTPPLRKARLPDL